MRSLRLLALILTLTIIAAFIPAFAATMPYKIAVDCTNNIVTVYSTDDDTIVRQMICSTGAGRYQTPHGTYKMPVEHKWRERTDWYVFEDGYGKWGTRIVGNYLFHSYLFTKMEDDAIDWLAYAAMGTDDSHGCVRLRIDDARWISENCFAGTVVKLYDNDEKRFDYLKELLYNQTYSIDSGLTYEQYVCMASNDKELGYNSKGDDVTGLQNRMIELGLYSGEADGVYNEFMVRAVKSIQGALGLSITGVVNESLKELLYSDDAPSSTISTLKPGMSGPAVKSLQVTLSSLGLYSDDVSGTYDDKTTEAVKQFERLCKYDETGIATSTLQGDMISAIAKLDDMYGEGNYGIKFEETIIESAEINSEKKLNMRVNPSTNSTIIDRLDPGTPVSVIDHGSEWTNISVNGESGYVKTAYLKFIENTRLTPAYVQASAEYPAIVAKDADIGTVIRAQSVTYGVVDVKDRLYIRESPSSEGDLLFMLAKQTPVKILSKKNDYAFISYGGKTGYANISFFKTRTIMELTSNFVSKSGEGAVKSDKKSAYITGDTVNLYSAASRTSEVIRDLSSGESAEVILEGTTWVQVKIDGMTGYVETERILIMTESEYADYEEALKEASRVHAVVSTGSDAQLNMRETASSTADIVLRLDNGTIVEIIDEDGAWYRVKYNWRYGYVMKEYLESIDASGTYDPAEAGYENYVIDEPVNPIEDTDD